MKTSIQALARRLFEPTPFLCAVVSAGFLLKSGLILKYVPAMTVWRDELFYFSTAYDMLHWGTPGVPHPQFLFYPPLTSLIVAPIHLLDLGAPLTYQVSLIVLNALLLSIVVAGYLIFRRLFGQPPRFLVLILLTASPAYLGWTLQSESPFVALYVWYLFFWVRFVQQRRTPDAVVAGILIAGMILTRPNAIAMLPVAAIGLAGELWARKRWGWQMPNVLAHLYIVGIPLLTYGLWKLVAGRLADPKNWNLGATGYLGMTFERLAASPQDLGLIARKLAANLGYVSLGTFGIAVPLVLYFFFSRSFAERRDFVVRLFLVKVGVFMLGAASMAALHMYVYSLDNPRPRYHMFGRYLEYFSAPLFIVALGTLLLVQRRSGSDRRSGQRWILGSTAVLAALCLLAIPRAFFNLLQSPRGVRFSPSNPGIAWMLEVYEKLGWAPLLVMMIAAMSGLAAIFLSPRYESSLIWRRAAQAMLLALLAINACLVFNPIRTASRSYDVRRAHASNYITNHPQVFAQGFYLDLVSRDPARDQSLLLVWADHVDRAIVGKTPQKHLGALPIVSHRSFQRQEILFQEKGRRPGLGLKIYGTGLTVSPKLHLTEPESLSGGKLRVGLTLDAGQHAIHHLEVSLFYDTDRLRFDPTDADGDGRPDAVALSDKPRRPRTTLQITPDPEGEIVLRLRSPRIRLREGLLLHLDFDLAPDAPRDSPMSPVRLSGTPDFRDFTGQGIAGYGDGYIFADGFESGDLSAWRHTGMETAPY